MTVPTYFDPFGVCIEFVGRHHVDEVDAAEIKSGSLPAAVRRQVVVADVVVGLWLMSAHATLIVPP